jgi:muramoyltetrapeptide carboxypeptidase LdcA involved in peptidoglycan recycling
VHRSYFARGVTTLYERGTKVLLQSLGSKEFFDEKAGDTSRRRNFRKRILGKPVQMIDFLAIRP